MVNLMLYEVYLSYLGEGGEKEEGDEAGTGKPGQGPGQSRL